MKYLHKLGISYYKSRIKSNESWSTFIQREGKVENVAWPVVSQKTISPLLANVLKLSLSVTNHE